MNKGVVLGSRDSNWYSGHYGGDPQCKGTINSDDLRTFNIPTGTIFSQHPYITMGLGIAAAPISLGAVIAGGVLASGVGLESPDNIVNENVLDANKNMLLNQSCYQASGYKSFTPPSDSVSLCGTGCSSGIGVYNGVPLRGRTVDGENWWSESIAQVPDFTTKSPNVDHSRPYQESMRQMCLDLQSCTPGLGSQFTAAASAAIKVGTARRDSNILTGGPGNRNDNSADSAAAEELLQTFHQDMYQRSTNQIEKLTQFIIGADTPKRAHFMTGPGFVNNDGEQSAQKTATPEGSTHSTTRTNSGNFHISINKAHGRVEETATQYWECSEVIIFNKDIESDPTIGEEVLRKIKTYLYYKYFADTNHINPHLVNPEMLFELNQDNDDQDLLYSATSNTNNKSTYYRKVDDSIGGINQYAITDDIDSDFQNLYSGLDNTNNYSKNFLKTTTSKTCNVKINGNDTEDKNLYSLDDKGNIHVCTL